MSRTLVLKIASSVTHTQPVVRALLRAFSFALISLTLAACSAWNGKAKVTRKIASAPNSVSLPEGAVPEVVTEDAAPRALELSRTVPGSQSVQSYSGGSVTGVSVGAAVARVRSSSSSYTVVGGIHVP